jgi:hypothetical protein
MISVRQDLACYSCSLARLRSSFRILDNDNSEPGFGVLLLQSGPRFRSSFRILDNDKCEPGFGVLLLQFGQALFQLQDSAHFKDLD